MKNFWEEIKRANRGISKNTIYIYLFIGLVLGIIILQRIFINPQILVMIIALFVAVIIHEVAHGYIAYLNGDPTAKNANRLTLNPKSHIDPIGTLVPVILILSGSPIVIGWAKPVPINSKRFRDKKKGMISVALAGVTTNLIGLIIGATVLKFFPKDSVIRIFSMVLQNQTVNLLSLSNLVILFFIFFIFINMALIIFNLIPIPPLDGSRIIFALGNRKVKNIMNTMERYGFIIIIALLYLGFLDLIIRPAFNTGLQLVLRYIGLQ
ncbi:MAG: site-2 protease family protein [Fusobacteriota bacterium]